jgi:hypothetical protein
LNAQLNYTPQSSKFKYTLYGKNIANKAYVDGITSTPVSSLAFYGQPREVGMTVDFSF